MNTKEIVTKEQALLERRRRRSNLEMLKLPVGAMKTMKDVADAADLPVDRVFKDVVQIGLVVVAGESSPYSSMIEFRKTLNETAKVARNGRGTGSSQPIWEGELATGYDEEDSVSSPAIPDIEGSGDFDVQSGCETGPETDSGVPVGSVSESPAENDQVPF